jgi:hypothetical protein
MSTPNSGSLIPHNPHNKRLPPDIMPLELRLPRLRRPERVGEREARQALGRGRTRIRRRSAEECDAD